MCGAHPFLTQRSPANCTHCDKVCCVPFLGAASVAVATPCALAALLLLTASPTPITTITLQCYCFVCDCPAVKCNGWGTGVSVTDVSLCLFFRDSGQWPADGMHEEQP